MNILISAVGGQGALLASRILGKLAQNMELDVKVSEVHGMSQRGGSVITYVKFGEKVFSPTVEEGTADIILAFELLEGARYAEWLKKNGTLIVSTQRIDPMPVITGAVQYPDNLIFELLKLPIKVYSVDALELASEAGSVKAANVVLIGILASTTNIAKEKWEQAIRETVPEKLLEINLKAFELGYEIKSNYSYDKLEQLQ
ncbi:indolepyruvate oxidoreductase subunit beta [Clostridium sp. DJ247]|uniref:indolepyruvate oxidoreductase subunit beta n=1 Tax=Clostridium sp. DJ247 TaxID=2726188 RepID=UPI001628C476|nr:indolepyruvate oxidoreductase subunit beta [Clostridium sp. DJ247]MBC2581416.1 indolepyruvate oxidoreductase subunit beta [Clostridium sp. DJ247]